MEELYKELASQIKCKTIDHLLVSKDAGNGGFDLSFTDGSSLELYVTNGKLYWIFNEADGGDNMLGIVTSNRGILAARIS